MAHVTELDWGLLKFIKVWSDAPLGTLLHMELPKSSAPINRYALSGRPAIDVSDWVSVCLKDPAPRHPPGAHLTNGKVYTPKDDGEPTIQMWSDSTGDDAHAALVRIHGPNRGQELDVTWSRKEYFELGSVVVSPNIRLTELSKTSTIAMPIIVTMRGGVCPNAMENESNRPPRPATRQPARSRRRRRRPWLP